MKTQNWIYNMYYVVWKISVWSILYSEPGWKVYSGPSLKGHSRKDTTLERKQFLDGMCRE